MMQTVADVRSAGREALARGHWEAARAAFQEALKQEQVPEILEGLSWAAWWLSDATAMFDAREHAHQLYRKNGDRRGAARMAMWLAADHVEFRGEMAIANGWRQRARRRLDGLDLSPEHGWLYIHEGALAIEIQNDSRRAKRLGAEAADVGRRLGVTDLEAIGFAMQGLALVNEGMIHEGTCLLDEAMAAAVGGELTERFSICWVTCYLIYACERIRDFDRAAEWCQKVAFAAKLSLL